MRPSKPLALLVMACLALSAQSFAALAAVNHVVISQFAARGPSAATDEFIELYNPTDNAISIVGWRLQYKPATSTLWSDRALFQAGATIPAHGYYLAVSQNYVGTVTPDFIGASGSTGWNSGTGMADPGGHEHLLDASSVEVDKVGWGTAIDPEGGVATPATGATPNNNSIQRKSLVTSTADSMAAGGAHSLLGNGWDTNVNGSDFVLQSHGRDPHNTASPPMPAFANGGNGTGAVVVSPSVTFTNRTLDSLVFAVHQDSSYTMTQVLIQVPTTWTWSHLTTDVVLAGNAFASATTSVVGETLFVSDAALTQADGGTITFLNMTTPAAKNLSPFTVRTGVAAGTPATIVPQPTVHTLELVPIIALHVNDANGVATAPYGVGTEATITGIVTANLNPGVTTEVYVQDGTAGQSIFSGGPGPITLAPGDSITVTGTIVQYRGLTELQPDFSLLVRHDTGRPVPDPMLMTCAVMNATFHVDGTEPNESRLIRINGVTYNPSTSTITDASGTSATYIPPAFPPVPGVFDAIGVLKQYKPGQSPPGPPYKTDYELLPRTPADIIAHPGPILLTTPYEDQLQPTSARLSWVTNVASTSMVRYGVTPALGDSAEDTTAVLTHALTVPGLQPATVYYYSAVSGDVNGANGSPVSLFCTASPPQSTGQINPYFNWTVDASLAWLHPAAGVVNLAAQVIPRIDNAQRSVDVAIYSMSGSVGAQVAAALINAKNRGVKVRVICEYENRTGSGFATLAAGGVTVINDWYDALNAGLGLMHNKFFVIDGRGGAPESVWVWTGSWNVTDSGTNSDLQNGIELQDQALSRAYTMEFEEMWGSSTDTPNSANSRFGAHKLDNTPHHFVIGGRNVECYFSPSDGTSSRILETINAAQHSIGFELLTLTRTDIADALIARHNAGIKVRGDLDNGTDLGSDYAALVTGGVDVHLKSNYTGLLHHKYMVVDGEDPHWAGTVLTGSHNWSSSAENSNNENTLIIHDPDIANQYLQEFSARYLQFGGADSVHVSDAGPNPSRVLSLSPAYPNPLNGAGRISYSLPTARQVELRLYDVQGRAVRTLVHARQEAGRYQVTLALHGLPSGVYLCRLQAGGEVRQSKMMLLK